MPYIENIQLAAWELTKAAVAEGEAPYRFNYESAEDTTFGDVADDFKWLDEREMPFTIDELVAKASELTGLQEATQYQRDRVYPTIKEQLDMQYWDSVNGTTTWVDAIAAVKAEYPKPE
jgi:hypothetical protein